MKVTFEMDPDQIQSVLKQELVWHLEVFRENLTQREEDGDCLVFFDTDPIQDYESLEQHIRAFELVLDYFGGYDE